MGKFIAGLLIGGIAGVFALALVVCIEEDDDDDGIIRKTVTHEPDGRTIYEYVLSYTEDPEDK